MITFATFSGFPSDELEKARQAADHLRLKGIASAITSCAAVQTDARDTDQPRRILRAGGGHGFTLRILDAEPPTTSS